jgi:molybdate transport system substrate-binding protein
MTRALALLLVVLAAPAVAAAAELTVLCPRGVQQVVAAAAEEFQRATRHNMWLSYGTAGVIADRALTEEADIVIASVARVTELEVKGAVRRGTSVALGSVGIGVAVRAGTKAPDVATAAKLRRVILEVPSLGYVDPLRGDAGRHFTNVLEAMRIAPLVAFKTTLFPDGPRALEALGKGEIALAAAPISEIAGVEGVALAGPLPEDLQQTLVYVAAVMTRSAVPDLARTFLAHLKTAEMRARFKAAGIEPAD